MSKISQMRDLYRKSTEEGLDQDFNSLDAQREACAAYVMSQVGQGWKEVKKAL
jgi:site-specific DNA recombinase